MRKYILFDFSNVGIILSNSKTEQEYTFKDTSELVPFLDKNKDMFFDKSYTFVFVRRLTKLMPVSFLEDLIMSYEKDEKEYSFYCGHDIGLEDSIIVELFQADKFLSVYHNPDVFLRNQQINYENIFQTYSLLLLPEKTRNFFLKDHFKEFYNEPSSINTGVTSICNFACEMCWCHAEDSQFSYVEKQHMPFDVYRNFIDNVAGMKKTSRLSMPSIGEFFLIPNWKDYLNYAEENNIPITITTNASLLNEEKAKSLMRFKCLNTIIFSVDSIKTEGMVSIRKNPNAKNVIANIKSFLTLYSNIKPDFKVVINCTVRKSVHDFDHKSFIDFWKDYEDVITYYAFFNEIGRNDNKIKENDDYPFSSDRIPCISLWRTCNIIFNGDIYKCGISRKYRVDLLGNIRNASLVDIWRDQSFQAYRDSHLQGNYNFKSCSSCQLWGFGGYHRYIEGKYLVTLRRYHKSYELLSKYV